MSLLCLPFWNGFWFSSLTPWDGRNTARAYSNSSIRVEWYLTPNINIADCNDMCLERRSIDPRFWSLDAGVRVSD